MIVVILLPLLFAALGECDSDGKAEKPLFLPNYNYPSMMRLPPLTLGDRFFNPHYLYDQAQTDYADNLQRQLPFQDNVRRLENFLYMNKQQDKATNEPEDDYRKKPNTLWNTDEVKSELEDLRFKRSSTFTSWSSPTVSNTNNLDDRAATNSRAVSVPFGPYTTWQPYEPDMPLYVSQISDKGIGVPKGSIRRRRRGASVDNEHPGLPTGTVKMPPLYSIPVSIAYTAPVPVPQAILSAPPVYREASVNTVVQNTDHAISYNVI